jgi:hypothetical protein
LGGAARLNAVFSSNTTNKQKQARKKTTINSFTNRDDLDFAAVSSMAPAQEFELQRDNAAGVLEYPTQAAKFGGVHSLDIHFPGCFEGSQSEVLFVGLKGEWSEVRYGECVCVSWVERATATCAACLKTGRS